MVCRRSQIRRFALAAFVVALAIGVAEHTGFTSVDESASAATLRRVRVQKVTPAAVHPAHGFGILMGPDLPPVYTSLAENAPAGPVHEFMLPDTQLWVAEGPQSGGWQRGGYALVPDPLGVAQCSSDLAFGTDYSDAVVPAGSDEYLVCVRNLYQAPDLALENLDDIVRVARDRGVDGMIVSNTTISRPPTLREAAAKETGGLSGRPLFDLSTRMLAQTFLRVEGQFPIVGVGGSDSAETAFAKIEAGATLLQVYSALVFEGVGLVGRIKRGLVGRLAQEKLDSLAPVVGRKAREWAAKAA